MLACKVSFERRLLLEYAAMYQLKGCACLVGFSRRFGQPHFVERNMVSVDYTHACYAFMLSHNQYGTSSGSSE